MENRKINSEVKIYYENINVAFGTMDKKHPNVIYFELNGYIMPTEIDRDYKRDLSDVEKSIRNIFNDKITERKDIFISQPIIVFEIADRRIEYGKKSYFTIGTYVKISEELIGSNPFGKIVGSVSGVFEADIMLIPYIFRNHGFSISKTKH